MIYPFTKISFETIFAFFVFGIISGTLYYTVLTALSYLSSLLSNEVLHVFLNRRLKELTAVFKSKAASEFQGGFLDVVRATFILILGVSLVFLNYALVDGIPRIYTIISMLSGLYLVGIIIKSKQGSSVFSYLLFLLPFSIFVLSYPIKLVCCIITKKRSKNYSIPTI